MPSDEIVQLIHEGASDKIGAEKLRNLLKILPYEDEVSFCYNDFAYFRSQLQLFYYFIVN